MAQLELDGLEVERSGWRCAKCHRPPGLPITKWTYRTDRHMNALVDCPCGHKWQEPGWQRIDGVWVDTYVERFGVGDGRAVWSRS